MRRVKWFNHITSPSLKTKILTSRNTFSSTFLFCFCVFNLSKTTTCHYLQRESPNANIIHLHLSFFFLQILPFPDFLKTTTRLIFISFLFYPIPLPIIIIVTSFSSSSDTKTPWEDRKISNLGFSVSSRLWSSTFSGHRRSCRSLRRGVRRRGRRLLRRGSRRYC